MDEPVQRTFDVAFPATYVIKRQGTETFGEEAQIYFSVQLVCSPLFTLQCHYYTDLMAQHQAKSENIHR